VCRTAAGAGLRAVQGRRGRPECKGFEEAKKPSCLGFAEQHLRIALQLGQDGVERKNIGIGFSS